MQSNLILVEKSSTPPGDEVRQIDDRFANARERRHLKIFMIYGFREDFS